MDSPVGFIGLGNVGAKLAGSLARNGVDLTVHDLSRAAAEPLLDLGARWAETPAELASRCEYVVTCLPNPAATRAVMEGDGGVLEGWGASSGSQPDASQGAAIGQPDAGESAAASPPRYWLEMSTTDESEVKRIAELVAEVGGQSTDCPVSGGCHRAATGNISIFAGCDRPTFEAVLPLLRTMGRRILHTGPLGSASVLKVVTNYLATANLASLCEALVTSAAVGIDLATTYEAIRISSGNSFVHETESQVMLNGSRDINFTMDLVVKDMSLFQALADDHDVPLELSPLLLRMFEEAQASYGPREWSPNIVRRLEEATGLSVLADGFPAEIVDDEPEEPGAEMVPQR